MRTFGIGVALLSFTQLSQACFPYGDSTLPSDLSAPNVPLQQWWCDQSEHYGFQGFSYPMETYACNSTLNSFEQFDADFAQMKRDFGECSEMMEVAAAGVW